MFVNDQPQYGFTQPSGYQSNPVGVPSGEPAYASAPQASLNTSPGSRVEMRFVAGSGRVTYLLAAFVPLALGLTALVAAFGNGFDSTSGVGPRIVGGVLGGIFTLIGAALALGARRVFSRALAVDAGGVRLIDPRGRAFFVQWSELSQIGMCMRMRGSGLRRVPIGFLDFIPGDAGFAGRHPEMSVLYQRFGAGPWWRLPLGPARKLIPQLDAALRTFGGPRYRGVVDFRSLPR